MLFLNKNNILVIIPAYNEERTIEVTVKSVREHLKDADILVINDASLDNTAENALKEKAVVLSHPFNMGIGVSFQTGCQFAAEYNYNYIIRIDADGQHDASFIKDIFAPIENNEADIVVGSRFLGKSKYKSSFFRLVGICFISFILSIISKRRVTDPTSGFCAMNKKAFDFFAQDCADDYPEPEILIHHRNFRIKEVPVSMNKRRYGTSSITFLKSIYYAFKVLFSLFVGIFRRMS